MEDYKKTNIMWRGTWIYGYTKRNKKTLTWSLISNLAQRHYYANWILFGDLNLIINVQKKIEGNPMDSNLTNNINNAFNDYLLNDLGFSNNMETWCNNQDGNHFIFLLDLTHF